MYLALVLITQREVGRNFKKGARGTIHFRQC